MQFLCYKDMEEVGEGLFCEVFGKGLKPILILYLLGTLWYMVGFPFCLIIYNDV